MKVRALIVDDEPIARAGLARMLSGISWVECVGEASNGPDAIAAIQRLDPELVFLDIQMPGLSGIEVLRRAPVRQVIFTTAWAQHAVTAFELGALDYLLKPFGPERLAVAMERIRSALGEPTGGTADRLGEVLAQGPMSRLFVRQGTAIVPVPVADIAWFEADGDYAVAHAGRTRHVMHVSLNRLEARLDPARFTRIHRTAIVNLDQVAAFRSQAGGRLVAVMRDGAQLPVSRSRARELRALGK